MIGFGVPWIALGPDRMWVDSTFLTIYEPQLEFYKQFGGKSIIYLPPSYKDAFEEQNDPRDTGVYPLYSEYEPSPSWRYLHSIEQKIADTYLLDHICPTDYIVTNKNYAIPQLAGLAVDHRLVTNMPLMYVGTNAGKDSVVNPLQASKDGVGELSAYHLLAEAASYLMVDDIVWTTPEQMERGLRIARRFLAPHEIRNIMVKHHIIGCGITDHLKGHERSEEEIRKEFQRKKGKDFSVSFVGRMTANKNVPFILDTMQPLFVRHGIKLDLRKTKSIPVSKRAREDTDAFCRETLGNYGTTRDDYAGKLLPSIQCLFYSSTAEGYCIIPREAIYIGVPVMLPDKPWARAIGGKDYPFYFKDENEAFALVLRIRDGRISDSEVDAFLARRRDRACCEFVSQIAHDQFVVLRNRVNARLARQKRRSHSKLLENYNKVCKVGETFTFSEIADRLNKVGMCIKIGRNIGQQRAFSLEDVYHFVHETVLCEDPVRGLFQRVSGPN